MAGLGRRVGVAFLLVVIATAGLSGVAVPARAVGDAASSEVSGESPLPVAVQDRVVPSAPSGEWGNRPPSPADALTAIPEVGPGQGFDEKRSVVDESQTTADRLVFDNPDGTTTVQASTGPVRFKGGDGGWQEYDLRLQSGAAARADVDGVAAVRSDRLAVTDSGSGGDGVGSAGGVGCGRSGWFGPVGDVGGGGECRCAGCRGGCEGCTVEPGCGDVGVCDEPVGGAGADAVGVGGGAATGGARFGGGSVGVCGALDRAGGVTVRDGESGVLELVDP